ncbi:MAG: DUF2973 domain-containing protein [Synechococcales cyanobacterium RM1_1_8]|nr:DUF2973 domain-containing protein [Synechococcales cyanobacterium RM1_1_8]
MLHLLYVLVFTVLAVLAVSNLIRNMMTLGRDVQRQDSGAWSSRSGNGAVKIPHPELLDASGQVVDEPLMVMRALPIEDVRSQLDALYHASPGGSEADSASDG